MNVLDLFSGIGGFSLGLERAGMRTVAFCEIEPFCRKVLAKNFPGIPCYDDVRTLTADRLVRDGIAADVICGGFPCQDISGAGLKAGIDGERSGLWAEFARLIGEIRPRYVIVENVADLLVRGIDRVLGDLAALRFDAEWHCIPACAVGAPHERDRVWIIAHAQGIGCRARRARRPNSSAARQQDEQQAQTSADASPLLRPAQLWQQQDTALREHWTVDWETYAASLRGVDDGVSGRVDGLGSLGNAVLPQIPELIGRAIMRANSTALKGT